MKELHEILARIGAIRMVPVTASDRAMAWLRRRGSAADIEPAVRKGGRAAAAYLEGEMDGFAIRFLQGR